MRCIFQSVACVTVVVGLGFRVTSHDSYIVRRSQIDDTSHAPLRLEHQPPSPNPEP